MRDNILFNLIFLTFLTCSSNSLSAENSTTKSLNANRIKSPVYLDGHIREQSWETAAPATGFTQRELTEGTPATEKTEVRVIYDDNNIYIGIMCRDSDPSQIIRNEMDRDVELISDDSFTIVIDTFDAKGSGYFFEINPNGAWCDGFFYGTELKNEDWDGVWDASAVVDDYGWSAEIKIPLKTLRFPNREIQEWGINFRRKIRHKNEEVLWCSWKRDDGLYQLMKAGKLHGITNISKRRDIEFEPLLSTAWMTITAKRAAISKQAAT